MKKRGRQSKDEIAAPPPQGEVVALAPPPRDLAPAAQSLWRSIVASRPHDFFTPGDLPLLGEYCHTVSVLLPRVNSKLEQDPDFKTLDARDKLVRQATALARSLRICVSARTRPDTASMRDSVIRHRPPWL